MVALSKEITQLHIHHLDITRCSNQSHAQALIVAGFNITICEA